jgi:hypothetical protein
MSYAIAHEMYMTMPRMRLSSDKRNARERQLNLKEAVVTTT